MSRGRRGRRSRRPQGGAEAAELDMTTFLNLMVVLVPFLLITAVFSRITIIELSLPAAAGGTAPKVDPFRFEVVVRAGGFELGDGKNIIARIPKVAGDYDLAQLGQRVEALKAEHPDEQSASVLLEPEIEYDHLVRVMDSVRSAERSDPENGTTTRIALFEDISIGDAP